MVQGEASADLASFDHEELALENFASLGALLKRRGVTHAVFAGGIGRRPKLSALKPSLALLRFLPRVLVGFAKGDDGALRALASALESFGVKVVGAHEIAPDLLASEGPMTSASPQKSDWRDIDAAAAAARAIGALDIGQAAVAIGGRAIALEGIEGTDGLLERVKALRGHGRIAGKTRGVLVKCAKPGQELRLDLPTIGPATVDRRACRRPCRHRRRGGALACPRSGRRDRTRPTGSACSWSACRRKNDHERGAAAEDRYRRRRRIRRPARRRHRCRAEGGDRPRGRTGRASAGVTCRRSG